MLENVLELMRYPRNMNTTLWVIKTTLPESMREFEVTSFAQSLVECGAACVQHHKVASTFQWEGAISQEKEWAVQIKVSNQNKQQVVDRITTSHPYDIPQIIAHQVEASQDYADWVNSQNSDKKITKS